MRWYITSLVLSMPFQALCQQPASPLPAPIIESDAQTLALSCRHIQSQLTSLNDPLETIDFDQDCQNTHNLCEQVKSNPQEAGLQTQWAQEICQKLDEICAWSQQTDAPSSRTESETLNTHISHWISQFWQTVTCQNDDFTPSIFPSSDDESDPYRSLASILSIKLTYDEENRKITGQANGDPIESLNTYAIIEDPVLKSLLSLAQKFQKSAYIANESILDEDLEELFSQPDEKISQQSKLAIYATLLPHLMKHAQGSGSQVRLRNLSEISRSLSRQQITPTLSIVCSLQKSYQTYEISFPFDAITADGAEIQLGTGMICPQVSPLFLSETFADGAITCQSRMDTIKHHADKDVEQGMNLSYQALLSKDNDGITYGLAQLSQGIESLAHHHTTPNPSWFCSIQTIYLMALEQHRFAELSRLEQGLSQLYRGTAFYDRLAYYPSCRDQADEPYDKTITRLWQDNGDAYRWLIKNFSAKARSKAAKAFSSWVKSKKSAQTLTRRLLGSWTAWCNGNYAQAANFAGDITEKKSRIVHPQLHAYDLMLKAAKGEEFEQEWMSNYVRVTMLKSAPLAYQALTAAAPLLPAPAKAMVAEIFRSYSPANASGAAAHFFMAYYDELRSSLSDKQRADINGWLDSELVNSESLCETTRRRLHWIQDLALARDYQGIERAANRSLLQNPNMIQPVRALWLQIAFYAQQMQTPEPTDNADLMPSYDYYEQCQKDNSRNGAKYLEQASSCWLNQQ